MAEFCNLNRIPGGLIRPILQWPHMGDHYQMEESQRGVRPEQPGLLRSVSILVLMEKSQWA